MGLRLGRHVDIELQKPGLIRIILLALLDTDRNSLPLQRRSNLRTLSGVLARPHADQMLVVLLPREVRHQWDLAVAAHRNTLDVLGAAIGAEHSEAECYYN